MNYITLYKDIPLGTKIIARDTLCVIAIAGDGTFGPDDEIHVTDGVYNYRE